MQKQIYNYLLEQADHYEQNYIPKHSLPTKVQVAQLIRELAYNISQLGKREAITKVRRCRLLQGLSQRTLAAAAFVSASSIFQVEDGSTVSPDTAFHVSRVLGLLTEELFTLDNRNKLIAIYETETDSSHH